MNLRWSKFAFACHFFVVVTPIIIIAKVCGRHSSDTSSGYRVTDYTYSLNGKVLTKENLSSSLLDSPVAVSSPVCSNEYLACAGASSEQHPTRHKCKRTSW
jgi:hypothetical protein